MIVRPATLEDDAGITDLMEKVPVPGPLGLARGCRPSFFQALRIVGKTPVVVVVEEQGEIVGVGAATCREVYFNGRVVTLRFLSGLRLLARFRGMPLLARGFACFRREMPAQPADMTLTSILSRNTRSLRVLTRARAGLPLYRPAGESVVHVLPSARREKGHRFCCEITQATDAGEIAGFITTHGASRNGFPVCRAGDLSGDGDTVFPGLSAEHIWVARRDGEILGIMGCWDVRRYRQILVSGYADWLRRVRPWYNAGARWCGHPQLPEPGGQINLAYGTLVLVPNKDPRVFRSLLEAVRDDACRRGLDYLAVAMDGNDPLKQGWRGLFPRKIRSRIFRVPFGEEAGGIEVDERPGYFEAAML